MLRTHKRKEQAKNSKIPFSERRTILIFMRSTGVNSYEYVFRDKNQRSTTIGIASQGEIKCVYSDVDLNQSAPRRLLQSRSRWDSPAFAWSLLRCRRPASSAEFPATAWAAPTRMGRSQPEPLRRRGVRAKVPVSTLFVVAHFESNRANDQGYAPKGIEEGRDCTDFPRKFTYWAAKPRSGLPRRK